MPGIILEGGTFRPIFSAGVIDALLDEDIMFPYMIDFHIFQNKKNVI